MPWEDLREFVRYLDAQGELLRIGDRVSPHLELACISQQAGLAAAVYGAPEYLPVDESHPTRPENYYGHTKLAIEGFLDWYRDVDAAERERRPAGDPASGRPGRDGDDHVR